MKSMLFISLFSLLSFAALADEDCADNYQSGVTSFKDADDANKKADFFYNEYVKAVKNGGTEADRCSNADNARKGYWLASKNYRDAYYYFSNAMGACAPYGEEGNLRAQSEDSKNDSEKYFNQTNDQFKTLDQHMTSRCSLSSLPDLQID